METVAVVKSKGNDWGYSVINKFINLLFTPSLLGDIIGEREREREREIIHNLRFLHKI